jgi:hypothetical protein
MHDSNHDFRHPSPPSLPPAPRPVAPPFSKPRSTALPAWVRQRHDRRRAPWQRSQRRQHLPSLRRQGGPRRRPLSSRVCAAIRPASSAPPKAFAAPAGWSAASSALRRLDAGESRNGRDFFSKPAAPRASPPLEPDIRRETRAFFERSGRPPRPPRPARRNPSPSHGNHGRLLIGPAQELARHWLRAGAPGRHRTAQTRPRRRRLARAENVTVNREGPLMTERSAYHDYIDALRKRRAPAGPRRPSRRRRRRRHHGRPGEHERAQRNAHRPAP